MSHRWGSKLDLDHLQYLSIAQLRDLLEDEETLLCSIRSSKKFQDLQKQSEVKWASNRRLAERNFSYQPYLQHNKILLAEKYQLLGQVVSLLRHKQKKLDTLHGRLRIKGTRQFPKQKAAQFMDESESLWQKFLEGNLLLLDFVESFQSTRMFYYRYLVQVEKMQDLSTHERQRAEVLSTVGTHSNDLHLNVFYGLPSVVMLPGTFLPFTGRLVKTSFLPPLNQHRGDALWAPFVPITNPVQSREGMRVWPQRVEHSRQYRETEERRPKPSP